MIKVVMVKKLEADVYQSICDNVAFEKVLVKVIRTIRPQTGPVYDTKFFVWSEAKDKIFFF